MGEVRHISVGERTGTRVRRATQCPACLGAAAGTLRVFILTVLLFLASGILPSAHNPAVSMWYGGAVGPGLVYAEELEPKRYNDVWLHGLEKRVSALLAPVYGAEHVVVQASIGEGKEGARPPVSLAVIIDTSVVPGFPTSPEGVRAEQERLASLISHAAGLKSARGDAIAISFLLFSGEQGSEQYLMYGLAGVVVLLGGIVCLLLGRKNRQKIDTTGEKRVRNLTDSKRAASDDALARLADRLRGERPQARAVVLMQLAAQDAAQVLGLLPRNLQAETLVCMTLQGPVEDEVLSIVRREFLQGIALSKERNPDSVVRTRDVLERMGRGQRERLLSEIVRISKRAHDELVGEG